MRRSKIEHRIWQTADRIRAAREELAVLEEQIRATTDVVEDARVRSLVSESVLAQREFQEAQRHGEALEKSRTATVAELAKLERSQDQLLGRLSAARF